MPAMQMFDFRVAVVLILIVMCSAKFTPTVVTKQKVGYPLKVHQLFQERQAKNNLKSEGVWSPWSSWTPCSRSCGGGVSQQIRHCVPKNTRFSTNTDNQKRHRHKRKLGNHCVGLYKRYHLCNTQKCPKGRDFRLEQCSFFNKFPFKRRFYYWEPFLQGAEECALNCRPIGLSFYATLNKTVIDGTSCFHPLTITGKTAPSGTRGVCVEGRCKSVASNGVIGSIDENLEVCSACRKGSCKSISGLYTKPDLPTGYSLITQIPLGACNVVIQQLMNTNNHIALKNSNGSFIINGDWKFGPSRSIENAGTKFFYKVQDATTKETISASGPLTHSVDILLVTQQPNPGIKYDYALPLSLAPNEHISPPYQKRPISNNLEPKRLDVPLNSVTQRDEAKPGHSHRRRVRKRFSWKIAGVSPCSKSCGGGLQTTLHSCVREHGHSTVSDKRCSHLDRPIPQQIRCNPQPCPAFWGGAWSTCTVSCGQGVQHFVVHCQQESATGQLLVVNDAICKKTKPTASTRPCRMSPCEIESDNEVHLQPDSTNKIEVYEWKVGPWSQCSVSCGTGSRSRIVSCPSGRCIAENRPAHAEYCDSGSCATYGRTSSWLVSEWSHCSEACGTGTQLRLVFCGSSLCESGKPETERACSSDRYCVGQWFVGPWGPCSDTCGNTSKQTREVLCLVKVRGQTRITNDMTCSVQEKPTTEKTCQGQCAARWFVGEWSLCEGNCPNGIQRRDVRCMDANGVLSNACSDSDRPIIKRACGCEKKDDQMNVPAQDEPQDNNCMDNIRNCHLVVQARLCQYQYYNDNCCMSCRKAPQDIIQ